MGSIGTVGELLEYAARTYTDDVAIVDETGAEWTYAEFAEAAHEVARAALALGIEPGDRVALWAPNTGRWIHAALGLLSAGAVLVPISTRYTGTETADIVRRARCRALFTVGGFLGKDYPRLLADSGIELPDLANTVLIHGESTGPAIGWRKFLARSSEVPSESARASAGAVGPDSISDILFTSGTTGAPKGAMATHGQTLAVYTAWTEVTTLRRGDRYLLLNPFSHTFGYKAGIVASVLRGATMVPVPVFDVDAVPRLVAEHRISVLLGPPTVLAGLLEPGEHDVSSLRLLGTGGTTVPLTLIERLRAERAVERVFTAYGLTESTGVASVCPSDADARLVAETAGTALPGTELRVVGPDGRVLPPAEHGEIQTRGCNVMHGYLDDPAATCAAIDADGWLHTGDVGTLDADGYLRITDRLKDMFIVGGFNAYPAEIERVLVAHPDIREVVVVGVPDDRLGEVGAAYVVPANGSATAAAITDWARERMAGFKVPRRVVFVDTLPRNASGKVLKRELRSIWMQSGR